MKSVINTAPVQDHELKALICDCLDVLLLTLPPKQANVLRAVDMEGAPPQSVADIQELSLKELNWHLTLGRQTLKGRFGEIFSICPPPRLASCDDHSKGDASR